MNDKHLLYLMNVFLLLMVDDAFVRDHDYVETSTAMDDELSYLSVPLQYYQFELVPVVVHVIKSMLYKLIVLYGVMKKDFQHHDVMSSEHVQLLVNQQDQLIFVYFPQHSHDDDQQSH